MLSLSKDKYTPKICDIVKGKRIIDSVYWHPTFSEKYANKLENIMDFDREVFRDMFELSRKQSQEFLHAIEKGEVIENSKFFKVKQYVKDALVEEMDLSDTKEEFRIHFKPKKEFTPHFLIVGSTNSGKTFWVKQTILHNLKGKKENKRQFVVISAQYDNDKTLKELRQEKYARWVTGFDCGEDGLKNSQFDTPEQYFQFIKTRIENAEPGTVVFADDYRDVCFSKQMRAYIDRGLRVFET